MLLDLVQQPVRTGFVLFDIELDGSLDRQHGFEVGSVEVGDILGEYGAETSSVYLAGSIFGPRRYFAGSKRSFLEIYESFLF